MLRRFEDRRLGRRLVQLYAGLVVIGVSIAFLVRANLGVMPWDVLHQGLAGFVDVSFGTMTIVVGVLVLLAWIPLRQRPGVGTISNALVIGVVVDATLAVLVLPTSMWLRVTYVVIGVALNALATAAYIGASLGPGPRDGVMTGIVGRTGWPLRWAGMSIEVVVVSAGWLLGGTFGPATVLYALAIGPLVHPLLPRLTVRGRHAVPARA